MIIRNKFIIVTLIAIMVLAYAIFHLKSERALLQVRYLMLACENCYHMEVIKSKDARLISETIIPESDKFSIEDLISKSLEEKQDLCLEGYFYIVNTSTLWIDPPGHRFKVETSYPLSKCEDLQSNLYLDWSYIGPVS